MKIEDLIARSSLGEGLSWSAFGKSLREIRLRFGVKVSLLSHLSKIREHRISEIESGAPPFASKTEVEAIAVALGTDPARLESWTPRGPGRR